MSDHKKIIINGKTEAAGKKVKVPTNIDLNSLIKAKRDAKKD